MKNVIILMLVSALLLASCSSASSLAASSGDGYTSDSLPVDYDGAMPVRNQLTVGLLMLDGTDHALTPEQAKQQLLLWQALRATQNSGASAQEETAALLKQIEDTLTPAQLNAIREMQLTNADMQAWAAENGITMGQGGGSGQGAGKNLSPEARATRQAEEGRTSTGSSGSSGSSAILEALIRYLQTLAQ